MLKFVFRSPDSESLNDAAAAAAAAELETKFAAVAVDSAQLNAENALPRAAAGFEWLNWPAAAAAVA